MNRAHRVLRISALGLLIGLVIGSGLNLSAQTGPRYGSDSDYIEVWGVEREGNSYDFYASNDHFIPVYINVSFEQLVSLAPDRDLPWRGAIPAETEEQYLFTLEPTTARGRIGYNLIYTFAMGDPDTADHDDDHPYLFPFAHGSKHRLTQGYNGNFSHFGENQYAVDFDMEIGTPVYAARNGVVVRAKENGRAGGPSMAYADHGNLVMIAHDDGSFGNYVHLRHRGAEVEVGDEVEAGELIGYSGNTGVSSGPHLHFDVRIPLENGRMQSIPFLFQDLEGEAIRPEEGIFYYASHPGGEPFEPVVGDDLTIADFADHEAEYSGQGRIEFRTEQYDLTYALFVANGLSDAIEATVSLNLVNMRAEGHTPVELTIPPRTEVFVTLLRADPAGNRWQYSPSVRYRRVE